ncbi:putative beta-lysine N-acetyltransferase [Methanoplanus limicola]|uniref:Beta-lysine acetyltransferase n=1 Tax=Methanoplanus limicola DSM 2279 TaxID=937775 RepID=H1Z0I5_9EURY|nr:putative beta-lysine N-acetyltransferase [Methanoplanus limicola]EHQ35242.1 beta-lysine acetyltransferase [Methanoplanus limicola DSM 2279]
MSPDSLTEIGNSLIQHGNLNSRIYIMKMGEDDPSNLISETEKLASENGYGKIFGKIPEVKAGYFRDAGYTEEAFVPEFFRGRENAVFLSRFLSDERKISKTWEKEDEILRKCLERRSKKRENKALPEGLTVKVAGEEDILSLCRHFAAVFETYPFPVDDPDFIRKSIDEGTVYLIVKRGDEIIAASSAEADYDYKNAEMTDFAVSPAARGMGIAGYLLREMEKIMKERGIILFYTIARSLEAPMNYTFAGAGYSYAGRLLNNTNICGSFESMNVWYKKI